MKMLITVAATAALLLGPHKAEAQPATVAGVVLDARTSQPLAGVRSSVEGQAESVDTDAEGRFSFALRPGVYVFAVSLVGYALIHQRVTATAEQAAPLTILLPEGAGTFEEQLTVVAAKPPTAAMDPASASIHGRELQALRGVTLDDPFRAIQALPSVAATDDFYSEFAIRGSPFQDIGLSVDGIPSRYLMHSVYGVPDGGSMAMINSDAVGSISLFPGSYTQRFGRRLGAEVDVMLRDGNREQLRARAGLSGTSAGVLAEGPLAGQRGSWLVSGRRSYLDLLLKRIDSENSLAFGFTDGEAKLVFDATPRHRIEVLALGGASAFEEDPTTLGVNDDANVNGRAWLSGITWRYIPSTRLVVAQRLYATGLRYQNRNRSNQVLDDSLSADFGWRSDSSFSVRPGLLLEFGADAQRLSGRRAQRRALNDSADLSRVGDYHNSAHTASGFAQAVIAPSPRLTVTPGARID